MKRTRLDSLTVAQLLAKQKQLLAELAAVSNILEKAARAHHEISRVVSGGSPSIYPSPPPPPVVDKADKTEGTAYYSMTSTIDPYDYLGDMDSLRKEVEEGTSRLQENT